MLKPITILFIALVLSSMCVLNHGKHGKANERCHLQHQVRQECGSSCPRNCENYGKAQGFCPMKCVSGCFCRIPYIFYRGSTGICVLPKNC
ncbi:hypothetical protein GDO81_028028 [Engystomops pustulosus]|uniref:TIL domain-containing protein n=1 Tax=Engystomops pustulosus TaxID=76066 RepID=A0AAV6ZDI3_ENGPU|nr:hypothetical protein GDO81_028028 [Engystomops pustulosus]